MLDSALSARVPHRTLQENQSMSAEHQLCSTLCYQHFIENISGRPGADNICGVKIKIPGKFFEFSQDVNHCVYLCSVVLSSEGKRVGRMELRWAEEAGQGFEHQERLSFTLKG